MNESDTHQIIATLRDIATSLDRIASALHKQKIAANLDDNLDDEEVDG